MKYEIWQEGYCATGGGCGASKVGIGEGETFDEAVLDWVSKNIVKAVEMDVDMSLEKRYLSYNKHTNPIKTTFWGCRVFPTEEEARKSFG